MRYNTADDRDWLDPNSHLFQFALQPRPRHKPSAKKKKGVRVKKPLSRVTTNENRSYKETARAGATYNNDDVNCQLPMFARVPVCVFCTKTDKKKFFIAALLPLSLLGMSVRLHISPHLPSLVLQFKILYFLCMVHSRLSRKIHSNQD